MDRGLIERRDPGRVVHASSGVAHVRGLAGEGQRAWLRFAIVTAVVLSLVGCSVIPWSTMWRFRNFKVADFFEKDPRQLRVAIRVDDRTKRGTALPQIAVDVSSPATPRVCHAFSLVPIDPDGAAEPRLRDAPGRRWFVYGLSPTGIAAFEKTARDVREEKLDDATVELRVTLTDVLVPPGDPAGDPVRIDLALAHGEGYFTLIDEVRMTPGATGSQPSKDAKAKPSAGASPCAPPPRRAPG